MIGRHLGRTLVGEFGRRSQAARMIDQRVAEPDPQLRVTGIAPDGILQDADRVLALAIARERFGHPEPGFGGREMAEESVTGIRQWEDVALVHAFRRRTRKAWMALQRVSRGTEQ